MKNICKVAVASLIVYNAEALTGEAKAKANLRKEKSQLAKITEDSRVAYKPHPNGPINQPSLETKSIVIGSKESLVIKGHINQGTDKNIVDESKIINKITQVQDVHPGQSTISNLKHEKPVIVMSKTVNADLPIFTTKANNDKIDLQTLKSLENKAFLAKEVPAAQLYSNIIVSPTEEAVASKTVEEDKALLALEVPVAQLDSNIIVSFVEMAVLSKTVEEKKALLLKNFVATKLDSNIKARPVEKSVASKIVEEQKAYLSKDVSAAKLDTTIKYVPIEKAIAVKVCDEGKVDATKKVIATKFDENLKKSKENNVANKFQADLIDVIARNLQEKTPLCQGGLDTQTLKEARKQLRQIKTLLRCKLISDVLQIIEGEQKKQIACGGVAKVSSYRSKDAKPSETIKSVVVTRETPQIRKDAIIKVNKGKILKADTKGIIQNKVIALQEPFAT